MSLPLLLSVPHAGLRVPPEVESFCTLTPREIAEDSDEGAAEIYALESHVAAYQTADVARAVVDLNRAPGDRRPDGVVKTHTCFHVPVYREFPPEPVVEALLERYYWPYQQALTRLASRDVMLAVDCHTMLAKGPPIGPGPGIERPWVCLSNADGTCPQSWIEALQRCFQDVFEGPVTINDPFRGGYITRTHAAEMPWVQLELSRAAFLSLAEKRERVLAALAAWCRRNL
ncbi:MAG: N-formylglutamate amidohydrolase [Bryobacterales bacterium]